MDSPRPDPDRPTVYRVRVRGHLDDRWADRREGLSVTREANGETVLTVSVVDQAALHGAERVDIIHGIGTGRLKKAVHEHLKHHALVKALHGEENPGVTVVELRE